MDAPAPQVSIVIPAFEEEESLPNLLAALDECIAALREQGRSTEVIVVDDGSTDETFAVLDEARAARPWLRAVRLARNYGQTAALSAAFDRAAGKYVVALDADMQNDPKDIPAMLDRLEEGYDVVSGWRKDRKDKALSRRAPSRIANWIIGRVGGLKLHDYGCTLKVYRSEFLENVRLYGEMHRFIPIYAHWEGARVTEMVVTHHPREHGHSKYGIKRTFSVVLDLMTVKFLGSYSTKPLYMFGKPGLAMAFAGVVCAAISLFQKIEYGVKVHRNPVVLLGVMLFIVGWQFLAMGLLAELQVRTYHESQQKPIYRVSEEVSGAGAADAADPGATAEG